MRSAHPGRITATDFYRYLQCPHWPYWERFGNPSDRRPLSPAEEERINDGLEHERAIVGRMFAGSETVPFETPEDGFARTLELMREGATAIYQGWLMEGDWVGRPDVLERQPGNSRFGDWMYVPIDVKRAFMLKKEHKAQLTFYALLLEKIQGHFPAHPAVINADGERLAFDAEDFLPDFRSMQKELERIASGERPEPVFRKTCVDTSPWGAACQRLAEERRDIALLFNVDVKRLAALRSQGVRTIDDAAGLDVDALEGQEPGLTRRALESAKRQAISLRDRTVVIREPFNDPTVGLEIHFDIESHPPTDADYLYGFWVKDGGAGRYVSFVAESPEGEREMWKSFLAWIAELPEAYTVYHYAPYEAQRLLQLGERYGDADDPALIKFRSALVDLKDIMRVHAVFPIYFYSLKTLAGFLGFHWEGDVKGGGESVIAYDTWLETGDRKRLNAIIDYNAEDVRATSFLLDWLRRWAKTEGETYAEPYPWHMSNL